MDNNPRATTRILFNPEFGKVHINPDVLRPKANGAIHVNPHFLAQLEMSAVNDRHRQGDIVTLSKTKLVRTPTTACKNEVQQQISLIEANSTLKSSSEILKIGNRKLVRKAILSSECQPIVKIPVETPARVKCNVYKVDRRPISCRKKQYVGKASRYKLRRSIGKQQLTVKKVISGENAYKVHQSYRGIHNPTISRGRNLVKKKCLLNIDGVLYKSTKTKLEKETTSPFGYSHWNSKISRKTKNTIGPGDGKCVHTGSQEHRTISGTFISTDRYSVINHLSAAKHKSILFLSRHLTKSNVPCPIFRKVGKCAAFERGRCPKIHDKKHVIICPRYLKGECALDKCSLSHEVNLSKMPTCKFYLQGCCTRTNCPYLHKKLNENAEVCEEFLKGYCKLGGECVRRHDFLEPESDSKAQSKNRRLPLIFRKNNSDLLREKNSAAKKIERKIPLANSLDKELKIKNDTESERNCSRYFQDAIVTQKEIQPLEIDEYQSNSIEHPEETHKTITGKRPKLGDLPAFIPL